MRSKATPKQTLLPLCAAALLVGTGLAATPAAAEAHSELCPIESGTVSVLANDFGALRAVIDRAEECVGEGASFERNQTSEHQEVQVPALTPDPAQFAAVVVANSSIVPLLNNGLIRPLDDLIEKYGSGLAESQKIVIGDAVMAIAFMANAQHFYYRADILEEAGVDVPTTYEEVLEAAEAIRAAGLMDRPFAMNTAVGWNLGEEFVNMYMGLGGEFFEPGTAKVAIDNEKGIAALEMLAALNDYADPDFLTFDGNASAALWEAGEVAMGQLWGSRASQLLDEEGAAAEIAKVTKLTSAMTLAGGSAPASTLWWDGFTIAANVSDEDAEATFRAMMHGISPGLLEENADEAVWLIEGFEPGAAATGIAATAQAGAKPYPMLPFMGLLHVALGDELAEFLQGRESAEQALDDVEARYTTAAREQGFVE